jgi:hypothetical protein
VDSESIPWTSTVMDRSPSCDPKTWDYNWDYNSRPLPLTVAHCLDDSPCSLPLFTTLSDPLNLAGVHFESIVSAIPPRAPASLTCLFSHLLATYPPPELPLNFGR